MCSSDLSNGVRSPASGLYSLAVVDLPTVSQLEVEYHFPAYTGLAPRKAEGGDVAAIRGTEVQLHIVPTMATPGGRILMKDGGAMPLTTGPDGSLTGSFKIAGQGFYKIELVGPHGEKVEASPQYTIDVKPGNTKVPRGADQAVSATLVGFSSNDVSVMMRTAPSAPFERVPLIAGAQPGTFEGVLFHLEKPTEYYVESNGVRSPASGIYTLAVVDLPTVSQLEIEYHFPAYTGLAPRKAEGGDVAAIRGTEVQLHVVPT